MEKIMNNQFTTGSLQDDPAAERPTTVRKIPRKKYIRIRLSDTKNLRIRIPQFFYDKRKRSAVEVIIGGSLCIIIILSLLISGISKAVQSERIHEFFKALTEKSSKSDFVIENVGGVTVIDGIKIANKTYSLPEDYGDGLTDETSAAFGAMQEGAAADGIKLEIVSGFRSYKTQKKLFESYCDQYGEEETETFSARPGHSEHQLGEAMDLNWIDQKFADTDAGKWLNAHAYEYGFILRYPPEKQDETGFIAEPWHFRYVGKELAAKLYNGGDWITIEDYFDITSEYEM
ncbi:MAG: M15 family metallopeptidase [Mogibacterium sp.]|nr:M15 family metallopeptidase [Mogibacterium sp.]